jgi:hypothetical protein
MVSARRGLGLGRSFKPTKLANDGQILGETSRHSLELMIDYQRHVVEGKKTKHNVEFHNGTRHTAYLRYIPHFIQSYIGIVMVTIQGRNMGTITL